MRRISLRLSPRARRFAANSRVVGSRSEEHTSELQSHVNLVCRLLLEKKKKNVIKQSEMALTAKRLGAKEWKNSVQPKMSLLPNKLFRLQISRNTRMTLLTMTNIVTEV